MNPKPCPQVTLRRNPSPDPRTDAALAAGLGSPQLVEGASALFLGRAHYGCVATVLPPNTVGLTRQVWARHLDVCKISCVHAGLLSVLVNTVDFVAAMLLPNFVRARGMCAVGAEHVHRLLHL